MVDALNVWGPGRELVGVLRRVPDGGMEFSYDAAYSGMAVSISMPVRTEAFGQDVAGRFFANLLPEGMARERGCEEIGISRENDFGLLAAIGGECAGALVLTPDAEAPTGGPGEYEQLGTGDLEALCRPDALVPLLIGGQTTRMSLAGAQDKLPVSGRDRHR